MQRFGYADKMSDSRIISTGVDIEQIQRFRDSEKIERLVKKLFTRSEIKYCKTKKDPAPHYTGKFCAKEALAKAIDGMVRLDWHEVEILHSKSGRPYFNFLTDDDAKLKTLNSLNINLTISHDRANAVAFVVISSK